MNILPRSPLNCWPSHHPPPAPHRPSPCSESTALCPWTVSKGEEGRGVLVGTSFPSPHLIPLGCLLNRFFVVGSHHEVTHGATMGHMGQHQLQTAAVTAGRCSVQLMAPGKCGSGPRDWGFLSSGGAVPKGKDSGVRRYLRSTCTFSEPPYSPLLTRVHLTALL